jgi:hypothetical protein
MLQHCHEKPPKLNGIEPSTSEQATRFVDRTLSKLPEDRYPDAAALIEVIEEMRGRQPNRPADHPRLPAHDPEKVRRFRFEWKLDSSPKELWPFISNTDRLNRAMGLKPVEFTPETDGDGLPSYDASQSIAGIKLNWTERPFEWVEGERLAVLREFAKGPLKWYLNDVSLAPRPGGGSTLVHEVTICSRNVIGRVISAVQVGRGLKKQLNRLYPKIDKMIGDTDLSALEPTDPYSPPGRLSGAQEATLLLALDRIRGRGVEGEIVRRLGDFIRFGNLQDLARIRPLALARRLACEPEQMVTACLWGSAEGLFEPLWDLLCPTCRIPSEVKESLRALGETGRCESCDIDFDLDFDNAIELIFRVTPEVRKTEVRTYCIGGPGNTPHVVAQLRLEADERLLLTLNLEQGGYRLRSRQTEHRLDFRVEVRGKASQLAATFSPGGFPSDLPTSLVAGHQVIELSNQTGSPLIARLERRAPREDALTAARVSTHPLFRKLFPVESLPREQQHFALAGVVFLVVETSGIESGSSAYSRFVELSEWAINQGHGAVVRPVDHGLLAAFCDGPTAMHAALTLRYHLMTDERTTGTPFRIAIHSGPAMTATVGGRFDYLGPTVDAVQLMPELVESGDLVLGRELAEDPRVQSLYGASGVRASVIATSAMGEWAVRLSSSTGEWPGHAPT